MASPLLEARDLSYSYNPQRPILEHWDAAFEAGEVVAITGPSGRGKSTLLYLLGMMLKPNAGQVLFQGEDSARLNDASRARLRADHFGFVFQDAALDATRTVLDNVVETALYRAEPRHDAIARAEGLLSRFGVELQARAKPGQVSGGQAQRIALCRALLYDPTVVLADEPTGNLDPASSEVVLRALHDRAGAGSVVIVVTHDPGLVAQCHRSIRL
jgi:putative ABC transport system ATP-binding protein